MGSPPFSIFTVSVFVSKNLDPDFLLHATNNSTDIEARDNQSVALHSSLFNIIDVCITLPDFCVLPYFDHLHKKPPQLSSKNDQPLLLAF